MDLVDACGLRLEASAPDVVALVGGGGKSSFLFRLAHEVASRGGRALITTTTRVALSQVQHMAGFVGMDGADLPLPAIHAALDAAGRCILVGLPWADKATGIPAAAVDELAARSRELALAAVLVEADGSRQLPVKAPASHEPVLPQSTTLLVPVAGLDGVGRPISVEQVHRPELVRALLGCNPDDPDLRLTPAMLARLMVHPDGGAKHRPAGARLLPVLNKADSALRAAVGRLAADRLVRQGHPALIASLRDAGRPVRERWAPLAVVVLAAGQGSRMGGVKQVLVVDGEPLVRRAVRVALDADARQVLVVTGAHAAGVQDALASLLARNGGRLRLVHNPDWASGQASSVHTALRSLAGEIGAALFMPVDQPSLPSTLLRRMPVSYTHLTLPTN